MQSEVHIALKAAEKFLHLFLRCELSSFLLALEPFLFPLVGRNSSSSRFSGTFQTLASRKILSAFIQCHVHTSPKHQIHNPKRQGCIASAPVATATQSCPFGSLCLPFYYACKGIWNVTIALGEVTKPEEFCNMPFFGMENLPPKKKTLGHFFLRPSCARRPYQKYFPNLQIECRHCLPQYREAWQPIIDCTVSDGFQWNIYVLMVYVLIYHLKKNTCFDFDEFISWSIIVLKPFKPVPPPSVGFAIKGRQRSAETARNF